MYSAELRSWTEACHEIQGCQKWYDYGLAKISHILFKIDNLLFKNEYCFK